MKETEFSSSSEHAESQKYQEIEEIDPEGGNLWYRTYASREIHLAFNDIKAIDSNESEILFEM